MEKQGLIKVSSGAIQYETFAFQSTLSLKKEDEVWIEISSMTTGAYLYGDSTVHFSGYLLEEDNAVV